MSTLPETICRMAKRLLKLAKQSGGTISVPNLSAAQEIISKLHGAQSTFDALKPGRPTSNVNEIALALRTGELIGSYSTTYLDMRDDQELSSEEIVFRLWSNDLHEFEARDESITGGSWDPAFDPHIETKYEIAISLRDYGGTPKSKSVLEFSKQMFEFLAVQGGGYVFGYLADGKVCTLS